MEKGKGVMGSRKWAVDFTDNSSTPSTRDIPDPPGFTRASQDQDDSAMSRQKKDAEANWKSQKAWEVAQSPFKNLLMMGFMMWMAGSTVYLFSIAQRLELASVYKGEADKILQVKKAEAKYLGGVGVARQRQAITDGLRENMLNFSHTVEGASSKDVMDLIMITQYFDTIKDLVNSSKNTTVFISHGPGHVRDISDQIRNGLMEGKAGVHAD